MEHRYSVKNTYEIAPVPNVCNQLLREIFKSDGFSIAHVTMNAENESLLHVHMKMREMYLILEGEGRLLIGDKEYKVGKEDYAEIAQRSRHKLLNIGKGKLEHLVIAVPAFDEKDVYLLHDNREELEKGRISRNRHLFAAEDGALIYEINTNEERKNTGIGLAYGILYEGKSAKQHFHKESDEIYYVISGEGKVMLDGSQFDVKKGSIVYMPKMSVHGLQNSGNSGLEVLCISWPPYNDKDHFPV